MFERATCRIPEVKEGFPIVLNRVESVRVRCSRGALWVTSGDGRELALSEGQSGLLEHPGKVVIVGMPVGDAEVVLR